MVRVEKGEILVALIRGDGLPGLLIPKGGVEAGETVEQAARREIEEEAGLQDLTLLEILGTCERLSFDRRHWQITHYFLFQTDQVTGTPSDNRHVYSVEWFPLDQLPPMFWPEQLQLVLDNAPKIVDAIAR